MKTIFNIIILFAFCTINCSVMAQNVGSADTTNINSENIAEIETDIQSISLDQAADEAYMRGTHDDFIDAIKLYKMAIERDGSSAAIYYNLGNAYYKVDSLAKAIICYERALRLNPTDADLRANLDFVNSKIIDVQPTDGINNVIVEKTTQMFSPNGWAIISIIIFIIVLILTAGYIFSRNVQLRKIYFFAGLILLLINIVSIIITITATSKITGNNEAVVVVESAQLSTSPSTPLNESQKAMLLHEGCKVKVIRELSTPNDPHVKKWVEVEAVGDNRAWIDANAIELI